ncbi:MAG: A24 family peptidase [Sphingomonadaceae bacterium]
MWPAIGALLGLVAGSFLATLVLRWPQERGLVGRSACDSCGATLKPWELVPLLSFLWQHGRCRHCGAAIDRRHPLIELSCSVVGALACLAHPGWVGLTGALSGWLLVALIALDAEHHWLPDALTLPLAALGLGFGAGQFTDRLIGFAAGGGVLLALALAYRHLRQREGLGMGDVKLTAALGAWLGWQQLPMLLLAASLIGLMLVAVRRLRGETIAADTVLPLGACLAMAAFPLWLLT